MAHVSKLRNQMWPMQSGNGAKETRMAKPKPHTFSFLLCLADDHNDISSLSLSLARALLFPLSALFSLSNFL
jgi:hypothetical protein